jgi:hypothetical protein
VIESLTEQERQMIECLRDWGVKNKDYWRLTLEFREGAWEIVLSSAHPARGTKVAVGAGQTFGQAWDGVASSSVEGLLADIMTGMSRMTDEQLAEIAEAEGWEDVMYLGQENGVDVFTYRLRGQPKNTDKLVGPRMRDLQAWCRGIRGRGPI